MLEILGIFMFCRHVGRVMRRKKRNPLGLQLATVVLWFGGELIGAVIGSLLWPPNERGIDPMIYVAAILGGVLGGVAAVKIAESRPHADQVS